MDCMVENHIERQHHKKEETRNNCFGSIKCSTTLLQAITAQMPKSNRTITKDGPETLHHNFDPLLRGPEIFSASKGIIWMETWRTLHSRRILHALSAISVHDSFRQASLEPKPSSIVTIETVLL